MRPDLRDLKKVADHSEMHELNLIVKPLDEDLLHRTLHDVSDPKSSKYGQFLSHQEVKELVRNELAIESITKYLTSHNIEIIRIDNLGYTITCRATINVWEQIFDTKFHQYEMKVDAEMKTVNRAKSYSIPREIADHLQGAFGIVDFPARKQKKTHGMKPVKMEKLVKRTDATSAVTTYCNSDSTECYVGPETINTYYSISNNVGDPYKMGGNSSYVDQAVYASIGQTFSTVDLEYFQDHFSIARDEVDEDVGGHKSVTCTTLDDCAEANLDVQYMLAISQKTKMVYDYVAATVTFSEWIATVAALENPYDVISISYGEAETYLTDTELYSFETSAKILGLQGVTIFSSSGDDGVAGSGASSNPMTCGYNPQFPTSCPYVTSVGATMGPESGAPEVVCSGDAGGVITSGGGFSDYYSMPEWQSTVVNSYISNTDLYKGYNSMGRAYPDISLLGYNYLVAIDSTLYQLSGTSASSPVFAAMISLINARRKSLGKSRVGWINPTLYSLYEDDPEGVYVIDITEGDNSCTAYGAVCCEQGFPATVGWDGATGLGSVDFSVLRTLMENLGDIPLNPTAAPTPSEMHTTSAPTKKPTVSPTQQSGYLTINSYLGDVCADDPYFISAYRTGVCLREQTWKYDKEPLNLWVKFECTSDGGYFRLFDDSTCTENFLEYEGTYNNGCSYSGDESYELSCQTNGGTISLSTMTDYTYKVGYNDDSCREKALYEVFMEDYCFVDSTNSSMLFQWPYLYYYNTQTDCSGAFEKEDMETLTCESNTFDKFYYVEVYGFDSTVYSYDFGHSAATYTTYKPTTATTTAPTTVPTSSPAEIGSLAIILTISGFTGDITDPDTQQAVLLATRDVSGLDASDSLEIIDTYRRRLLRVLSTVVTVEMAATVYLSNHPTATSISALEASIATAMVDAAADGSLDAALVNECTGNCGTSFTGASTAVSVSTSSNSGGSGGEDSGISGGAIAAIVIVVLFVVSSAVAYIVYRQRKFTQESSALKAFELSDAKGVNPMQSRVVAAEKIQPSASNSLYKTGIQN
jgi:tripeptidyl-peptidase-1